MLLALPPWRISIITMVIIVSIFLLLQLPDYMILTEDAEHVPRVRRKDYIIKTEGCKIPHMDPFDPAIMKYIWKPKQPVCNNGIPALYKSNFTSLILQNSSLPYYNISNLDDVNCYYQEFTRRPPGKNEKDNKFNINGTRWTLANITDIPVEYIIVTCELNKKTIYTDLFWFFHTKENVTKISDFDPLPMNVLVVGLDAVSRLNLHRQMPKTLDYLHDIGAVELEGYTKVGDNTFPNLVTVFTGKYESELKNSCWVGNGHFDKCNFLWNMYKEKKYTTALGEDCYWMSIFNFNKKGFTKQPADYVYGYFNNVAEKKIGNTHQMNVDQCIGDRMVYKDLLNYITNFTLRMTLDESPYFAFFWGASLSHDYLNNPSLGDEDYYNFFKFLKDGDYLRNTALVFMSDHGIRWGDIRKTYQGRMEERMPFAIISLPDWYKKKYKQAYNNLIKNSIKLTTPFDLHETLKDLINPHLLTDQYIHQRNVSYNRGISFFNDIPETRTCDSATIASHWCACQQSTPIATNDTKVIKIGEFVVESMNEYFTGYSQCANLKLVSISDARLMVHGETIMQGKQFFQDYMITIQTTPGDGIFEATVRIQNDKNSTKSIVGTISRLNLYGTQSACISDFHLKLYCYCKSLLE